MFALSLLNHLVLRMSVFGFVARGSTTNAQKRLSPLSQRIETASENKKRNLCGLVSGRPAFNSRRANRIMYIVAICADQAALLDESLAHQRCFNNEASLDLTRFEVLGKPKV